MSDIGKFIKTKCVDQWLPGSGEGLGEDVERMLMGIEYLLGMMKMF